MKSLHIVPLFVLPMVPYGMVSCGADAAAAKIEATSLLSAPLLRLELEGERLAHYESELASSTARWDARRSEDDAIWVGRHLAYLGRYGESIDWYTARLADFPDSVRLRRHRGHRYLSTRMIDDAIADFEDAWKLADGTLDEIEPDGAPNELGIPRSTTHTNVLYHLGLARYVKGEFEEASRVWKDCLDRCSNDDMRVATLNWYLHALRRSGNDGAARALLVPLRTMDDVIENHAYRRIVLFQERLTRRATGDDVSIDEFELGEALDASYAYGYATARWCDGEIGPAETIWRRIVDETPWNAFGHLAAEAELARLAVADEP